jgi:hypothetical protein
VANTVLATPGITVNSIVYLVHDIRVTSGRTVKRMTITIRKPDSVTYTTA